MKSIFFLCVCVCMCSNVYIKQISGLFNDRESLYLSLSGVCTVRDFQAVCEQLQMTVIY